MIRRSLTATRAMLFVSAMLLSSPIVAANAACFQNANVSADELANFRKDPSAVFTSLRGGPSTNAEIISRVRDLASADKANLKLIIELLTLATLEQKSAIGTALGQAAQACFKTDSNYSAEIQQALAASNAEPAILAFAAVTGNVPIGAAGGGAGGGAGSGGSGAGGSSVGGGPASGSGGSGTTDAPAGRSRSTTPYIFSFSGPSTPSPATTILAPQIFVYSGPTTSTTSVSNALTSVSP